MTTQAPDAAALAEEVAALREELIGALTIQIFLWPRMCAGLHHNLPECECRDWMRRSEKRLAELNGMQADDELLDDGVLDDDPGDDE